MLKVGLLAGVAMIGMIGASRADTASGGTLTYSGFTDYNQRFGELSKFNTAAGTLTGVTFTISYGFNSQIVVTAGASDSFGTVYTQSAAQFLTSDASISSILDMVVNVRGSASIAGRRLNPVAYNEIGTASDYDLVAGTSSPTYTSTASGSDVRNATASELDAFKATGTSTTFDVYGRTLTGTVISQGGGNASTSQVTTALQSISVLYTYTAAAVTPPAAVPEPASLALLGAGLLGLGMIRRKSV